ncbi:MAG: hypothetical protein SXQ77_11395, partial [Halobacteria archaeon]|nr:hypothetical protein [Halobacteria archaeon]
GSLRYAFGVSNSLLIKAYALVFVGVSAYITLLWILAIISWTSKLADAPPTGNIWGFLPFLVVVYLGIEFVLFLPLYLPLRRYRNRRK